MSTVAAVDKLWQDAFRVDAENPFLGQTVEVKVPSNAKAGRAKLGMPIRAGGPGSGCHGDNCGRKGNAGGTTQLSLSERARRALAAYQPATKEMQQEADASEALVAKAVRGQRTANNRPFDVVAGKTGIEVKTLIKSKVDKVTMRKECLLRKNKELQKMKLKQGLTVVFDRRAGRNDVYVKRGFGSFRLQGMTRLPGIGALSGMVV